ncbi:uncharacterized protein EI97DRAFT_304580 [Westerdykella ornata]|uniref:DRBM domain-containing protein n=1 Tax=Westerdykella ornata TaxID=318751 RepID=A0A6A6JMT4_WESOR|nr:uncharacterized protein EI97DRAFT_304580 [Westerdykella ornata]KAF2276966.1 hypothetical protein EI97DRAFT_304580 [Westerdykella ornata]
MALPTTDTLPLLTPLPASHSNSTKSSSSTSGSSGHSSARSVLDAVLNIDEFLAAHPLPAPPEKNNAGSSSNSKKAQAKKKTASAGGEEEEEGHPVPKALSLRSGEYVSLLNTKVQLYALARPQFEFSHVAPSATVDEGWGVRMRLLAGVGADASGVWGSEAGTGDLEVELEERGPFASKQEAKEAVCARALEVLKTWEEEGRVGRGEKGKKRKGGAAALEEVESEDKGKGKGKEKEVFVNWTGLLLEFQRSNSAPQPTYTDFVLDTRFSCTCTLDNVPGRTFGSPTDLFANKKAARQNASRLAVEYFQEVGEWPEGVGLDGLQVGIKKKKQKGNKGGVVKEGAMDSSSSSERGGSSDDTTINENAARSPSSSNPEGQTASAIKPKAHSTSPLPPTTTTTNNSPSYASLAASLAHALHLGTPQYHFHRSTTTGAATSNLEMTTTTTTTDFHTVSCTFPQAAERRFRDEPVALVRHVHGKKRAREECARVVVGVLEGLRRERRELLERGGGMDGDVDWEKCTRGFREPRDWEREDVFEDAVEVMSLDG